MTVAGKREATSKSARLHLLTDKIRRSESVSVCNVFSFPLFSKTGSHAMHYHTVCFIMIEQEGLPTCGIQEWIDVFESTDFPSSGLQCGSGSEIHAPLASASELSQKHTPTSMTTDE